jgi:plastocyanin
MAMRQASRGPGARSSRARLIFFRANELTGRRPARNAERVWRALALAMVTLALLPASSESAQTPRLVGTVGPGFTIDLADASGTHVSSVVAGRYELLVHDLSDMHNFVLGSKSTGERLATTEVEFVGDRTFTIDLVPGRYAYACSPHFETMNGHLTVFSPPPPPAPTRNVTARVDGRSVTLSTTRTTSGRFRVRVVDRSRTRNFHLRGPGVDRRTSKPFVGTATWTLELRAGTYRFGSDPRLSGRLVVGRGT